MWFVLLLISGALVADWAANLNSRWCNYWNVPCEVYECAAVSLYYQQYEGERFLLNKEVKYNYVFFFYCGFS